MWVGKVNCLWHNARMPETLPRPCSVAAALGLIGEKWSLLVIRELAFRVQLLGPCFRCLRDTAPRSRGQQRQRT